MYGLSIGVSRVNEILPGPAYALLSGLNSATVGIIALAAVQLAQKAITDKVTRILVFLGAAAGMLYNALWYFPLLMFLAGFMTVVWDFRWLHRPVEKLLGMVRRRTADESEEADVYPMQDQPQDGTPGMTGDPVINMSVDTSASLGATSSQPRAGGLSRSTSKGRQHSELPVTENQAQPSRLDPSQRIEERVLPVDRNFNISWQFGGILITGFFMTFATVMVLRGVLKNRPLLFSLFVNLYLAGTIIFGGGPVVIPLLRESVQYPTTSGLRTEEPADLSNLGTLSQKDGCHRAIFYWVWPSFRHFQDRTLIVSIPAHQDYIGAELCRTSRRLSWLSRRTL